MVKKKNTDSACPCGSGREYADCCRQYVSGEKPAPTAEALMRSRYSAYVLQDEDYLLASWYPSTRPERIDQQDSRPDKWLGLKIVSTYAGGADDTHGQVEFVARYKLNGKAYRLHEKSRFIRENNRWFYLDGDIQE